ncbi:MAG: hypothetical protein R2715_05920 [Ilumatobacteraceae bacterium]
MVLANTDPEQEYRVERGDRIAQLVVLPFPAVAWNEVVELDGDSRWRIRPHRTLTTSSWRPPVP